MPGVREWIADLLGADAADPRWRARVEDLLYEGETVQETVEVEDARLVVTSHRVLAFTPGADGAAFRQVDRPNVVGVSTGAEGERHLLWRGARWSAIGLVLVVVGALVDMDAILGGVVPDSAAGGQLGIGGALGAIRGMLDLLRQLDELLQVFGALAMVLGVVAIGAYLYTREPRLVVAVSGDDEDLLVPRPDDAPRVVQRLEAAIFPDGPADPPDPPDGEPDALREA